MKTRTAFKRCASGPMMMLLALPALGQELSRPDALEEIVVTATRRSESLLDVPISVAAYGQETLDAKGVRDIEDLARITPGVTIGIGFSGIKYIAVRGLFSSVGATMTGVYIDETPVQVRSLVLSTNFYPALFDLERVEVLRGPQGTLFGSGAMGGAVRFIRPKPGLTEYSGSARTELAFTEDGDPSYEAAAAFGGPIVEGKLGFRASAYHRRDGGYIDRIPYVENRGTAEENSNSDETSVANLALTFAPTERLTITPSVLYQQVDRNDTDQYWTFRDNPTVERPALPRFVNGEGLASFGKDKAVLYSLEADYDLGGASLISNTAYLDRKTHSSDDASAVFLELLGGLAPVFGQPPAYFDTPVGGNENALINLQMTQRSFTQELRLQSNPDADSRLSYVLGLFYQNSRQTSSEQDTMPGLVAWSTALFGFPLFGAPEPGGVLARSDDRSRDQQYAGFGQLDYKLTDRFTATAGVRVSRLKYDFDQLAGGPFNGSDTVTSGSTSETAVTPKFGIQYEPTSDWMVYASAGKGFRPGGSNPLANKTSCAADLAALGITETPAQYESDSVWSYEVGAKGRVGRTVTLAASVFNIDWTNIQRPRVLPGCSHVFLDNLGSARSRGFDAQITLYPVEGLTLDVGVGYMDTTYRETIFTEPSAPVQGTLIRKGARFAVPWIGTVAADYETSLGSGGLVGYSHVQYDVRSSYSAKPGNISFNPVYARVDDQHFVAARVGVRRGALDVSLFVDNLLNSRDIIGKLQWVPTTDRVLEQTYRPRTFGVTANYRF